MKKAKLVGEGLFEVDGEIRYRFSGVLYVGNEEIGECHVSLGNKGYDFVLKEGTKSLESLLNIDNPAVVIDDHRDRIEMPADDFRKEYIGGLRKVFWSADDYWEYVRNCKGPMYPD